MLREALPEEQDGQWLGIAAWEELPGGRPDDESKMSTMGGN